MPKGTTTEAKGQNVQVQLFETKGHDGVEVDIVAGAELGVNGVAQRVTIKVDKTRDSKRNAFKLTTPVSRSGESEFEGVSYIK